VLTFSAILIFCCLSQIFELFHNFEGLTGCGNITMICTSCGPEQLSRYSSSLRDGRSRDRIPVGGGGRDFPHPCRPALGPNHSPIQWVPGIFPGGKAAGAWP
jgi:hypothetical protein